MASKTLGAVFGQPTQLGSAWLVFRFGSLNFTPPRLQTPPPPVLSFPWDSGLDNVIPSRALSCD